MSEYDDPDLDFSEKVRGALMLIILLGGGLFFLIREVFF